jgi:hypothetical protein
VNNAEAREDAKGGKSEAKKDFKGAQQQQGKGGQQQQGKVGWSSCRFLLLVVTTHGLSEYLMIPLCHTAVYVSREPG